MRLHSSLLGAAIVFFDCVNASSTRPDSTIVTSLTPGQHDAPVRRFLRDGAKTNEKERDFLPTVETLTKFVSSSASHLEEYRLYCKLMATRKSVEDAFTSFKLHEKKLPTLHFNVWVRYAAAKGPAALSDGMIGKIQEIYGPGGLAKMLEAFRTVEGTEDVVPRLESKMIDFWKAENTPVKEAFSHMGLDKPTGPLLRERLLNTWFEYGNTKEDATEEMVEAIDSCGDEMRLAVLESLRKIEGTDGVVKVALSHLMTYFEKREAGADLVFKLLKLDQRDTKHPRTFHFDAWVMFAARSPTLLSKLTLKSVFDIHKDVGILELAKAYRYRREDFTNLLDFGPLYYYP